MDGYKTKGKDGTEYICFEGKHILAEYFHAYMGRNFPGMAPDSPIHFRDIPNTPINHLKINLLNFLTLSLQEEKKVFAFFTRLTRKKEREAVITFLDVLCKRENGNSLKEHHDTLCDRNGSLGKMLFNFCWDNQDTRLGTVSITPVEDFLEALAVNPCSVFGHGN